MMEIENGGQACLVIKQLVEWMDNADTGELERVKEYMAEMVERSDTPEMYLYSSLWSYLTDKGA